MYIIKTVDQVMEVDKKTGGVDHKSVKTKPLRKFTWQELSQLNGRHNAHVAVRGKVTQRAALHPHLYTHNMHPVGV